MKQLRKALMAGLVCVAFLGLSPGHAQSVDPHELYEQSCGGCHAFHAGDFVFESLDHLNGVLVGRSTGQPVEAFLQGGHGRLSSDEIEVILVHLAFIWDSGRLFHNNCSICHVRMVDLARLSLISRDGALYGRYTERLISEFLLEHGRLTADEVPRILVTLERQLAMR